MLSVKSDFSLKWFETKSKENCQNCSPELSYQILSWIKILLFRLDFEVEVGFLGSLLSSDPFVLDNGKVYQGFFFTFHLLLTLLIFNYSSHSPFILLHFRIINIILFKSTLFHQRSLMHYDSASFAVEVSRIGICWNVWAATSIVLPEVFSQLVYFVLTILRYLHLTELSSLSIIEKRIFFPSNPFLLERNESIVRMKLVLGFDSLFLKNLFLILFFLNRVRVLWVMMESR